MSNLPAEDDGLERGGTPLSPDAGSQGPSSGRDTRGMLHWATDSRKDTQVPLLPGQPSKASLAGSYRRMQSVKGSFEAPDGMPSSSYSKKAPLLAPTPSVHLHANSDTSKHKEQERSPEIPEEVDGGKEGMGGTMDGPVQSPASVEGTNKDVTSFKPPAPSAAELDLLLSTEAAAGGNYTKEVQVKGKGTTTTTSTTSSSSIPTGEESKPLRERPTLQRQNSDPLRGGMGRKKFVPVGAPVRLVPSAAAAAGGGGIRARRPAGGAGGGSSGPKPVAGAGDGVKVGVDGMLQQQQQASKSSSSSKAEGEAQRQQRQGTTTTTRLPSKLPVLALLAFVVLVVAWGAGHRPRPPPAPAPAPAPAALLHQVSVSKEAKEAAAAAVKSPPASVQHPPPPNRQRQQKHSAAEEEEGDDYRPPAAPRREEQQLPQQQQQQQQQMVPVLCSVLVATGQQQQEQPPQLPATIDTQHCHVLPAPAAAAIAMRITLAPSVTSLAPAREGCRYEAGGDETGGGGRGGGSAAGKPQAEDTVKEEEEGEEERDGTMRKLALMVSVLALVLPLLLLHFMDHVPARLLRLGRGAGAGEEEEEVEVAVSKRVAYRVDVLFSTHSFVKPVALLGATVLLIALGGLALYAVSAQGGLALADALWLAWTYVADSGNHADSAGLGPRVVAVSVSFGGMLVFALMLGLVSDAISEKVDSLRKGRSEVVESRHALVLGWSDKLASLLTQLAKANHSMGGGVVVILAERDKEEMEADIARMELPPLGTSFICRSGSPLVLADLKRVSVATARCIIVVAEDVDDADQSDARALRVVLSLTGVREGLRGHVVVELSDLDNEQLVKLVGGHLIETVVAHDVIGRLMIQCARQPGLAQIWEDILGFDNCEFYMKRWPQLAGVTFGDALVRFPDAVPIGVKIAAESGRIVLNPEDSYVLQPHDALLVVAEDDDSYAPGPPPDAVRGALPRVVLPPKLPEKMLFCGWRRDIDDMIVVLEAFLAAGSELWMFSDVAVEEREKRLLEGGLNPGELHNITLVHRCGNAVIRRHLESLPLETFDSILILADEGTEGTVISADSRSLATLLLIRDIQSKRLPHWSVSPSAGGGAQQAHSQQREPGSAPVSAPTSSSSWVRQMQHASQQSIVISEILDSRTRSLVAVSKISDYVLSNELVSMALAMVAEDREINRVLEELFAEEGNEMYIRAAEMYLSPHKEELSFFEVMLRGRQRMELIIGYRLASAEAAVINPPNKALRRKWSPGDSFVVFALEE